LKKQGLVSGREVRLFDNWRDSRQNTRRALGLK
jgi:hypothetical protein